MVPAIIPPASIRILDLPYRGMMTMMTCGDNSSNADEPACVSLLQALFFAVKA
jgi:hypothetical protein